MDLPLAMAAQLDMPLDASLYLCQSCLSRRETGREQISDVLATLERVVRCVKTCLEKIPAQELVSKSTLLGVCRNVVVPTSEYCRHRELPTIWVIREGPFKMCV